MEHGVWLDPWQRPWPNFDRTLSRAPWHPNPYFAERLEAAFPAIRDEYIRVVQARGLLSTNPVEDIVEAGAWDEFNVMRKGRLNRTSCLLTPKTCAAIEDYVEITGTVDGQLISGEVAILRTRPAGLMARSL